MTLSSFISDESVSNALLRNGEVDAIGRDFLLGTFYWETPGRFSCAVYLLLPYYYPSYLTKLCG